MMNNTEQRKYFRLSYKSKNIMPTLRILSREYKISEISEQGMRVIIRDTSLFKPDDMFEGEILLNSVDSNVPVKGQVLRIKGNEVIFLLSEGLSFKEMISEQRFIRKHYPDMFPKNAFEEQS